MADLREAKCFQQAEKVGKVSGVESDECPGSDDRFVPIQFRLDAGVSRQRPQEPSQSVHVAALFQRFAHSCHLVGAEVPQQRPRRNHLGAATPEYTLYQSACMHS